MAFADIGFVNSAWAMYPSDYDHLLRKGVPYYMNKEFTIKAVHRGKFDVIVCGAGTAGCAAAIAAARNGAKTLLIERSFAVGGMLTVGNAGITKYTVHYTDKMEYRDKVLRVLGENPQSVQIAGGISKEYVDRMIAKGGAVATEGQAGSYVFADRYEAQWTLMDMLDEAGVEVLYDTKVCQPAMDGNEITGVLVFNKNGFSEYSATCVIDATGDADVAVMAGAEYVTGVTQEDIDEGCGTYVGQALHNGCMFRVRGVDMKRLLEYVEKNQDRFIVHEFGVMMLDDVVDSTLRGEMSVYRIWLDLPNGSRVPMQIYNAPASDEATLLPGNQKFMFDGVNAEAISKGQHDLWRNVRQTLDHVKKTVPGFENARMCFLPDIGIRETRRITGDYRLTGQDLLDGVDFEDSIGCGGHPVDIKPLRKDILDHHYENWRFHMPYRIMLPKGIENLLVAGRSVSASRMANGSIRPTVQCMVLGEAAGTAAAISVKDGVTCRQVDVAKLRKTLLDNGAVI